MAKKKKKVVELGEEALDEVSGGRKGYGTVTYMQCKCGYSDLWAGNYKGRDYDCPNCGKHTLHGN